MATQTGEESRDMRREYGHEKRIEQYFQGLRENNPTAISTGPISSDD